jgi:signal transduction histidine kinase
LEAGAAEWHVGPVDLRQVVTASTEATAQLFRDRAVALDLDFPRATPPVAADADRVVQVMLNLLGNAVKFADPEHGRVRVGVEVLDGEVRVDVDDNGAGVPEEDRELIFDKFRQGTHRDRPPGTGLGLPISREIVDHLGGRLWVASRPGPGARFSFTLPVAEGEG